MSEQAITPAATPADELARVFDQLATSPEELERRRVFSSLHDRMFGSGQVVCVGRFVLQAKLGSGGMGVVYAAYDPQLDRKVALKLLHEAARDVEAIARLEREARALARLRHPNVVAVHEVGHLDGQRFIAMDLVEGETLRTWMLTPRSWREVVALLVEAGRGLAAAHDAGLVHRDFKPDNVLVEGGHARVVDFGLARPQLAADRQTAVDDQLTTDELTQTGAMLGTPAYMAPEAFVGAADARSDQFGFCVVLYEALYGTRPFAGDTVAALCAAVGGGELVKPARNVRVPAQLRRALLRGLAVKPTARWPDMHALIAELERHGRRSTSRKLAAATIVGTVLGAGAVAASRSQPDPSCMRPSVRLAEVWNAERRAAVGEAFAATGLSYAVDAWSRSEPVLDDYATSWARMRQAACASTHVDGDQSEGLLAARLQCLERGLDELEALVAELGTPDEAVVTRAVEASRRLRPLPECEDESLLIARLTLADAMGGTAAPPELYARLARAEATQRTGKYAAASSEAHAVADAAEAGGYLELAAESQLLLARLELRAGHGESAIAAAKLATWRAEQLGDGWLRAQAQTQLVAVLAEARELDRANDWAQLTAATVKRLGDPLGLRAGLAIAQGNVLEAEGRHAEAATRRREALALQTELLPPNDPTLAHTHYNLGRSLVETGQAEEGRVELEAALALRIEALGPNHPDVARSYLAISESMQAVGRIDDAVKMAERAVSIAERALGPEHVFVGRAHGTLAIALAQSGTPSLSVAPFRRSVAILEAVKGKDDLEVGYALGNLGRALAEPHSDEAIEVITRALRIHEVVLGAEGHADTVYVLNSLADAQSLAGRWADAAATADRAVAMGERTSGPDHATVAEALYLRGRAERMLGRSADARASLQASIDRFARTQGRKARLAQSRVELARALEDLGAVDDARLQMQQARAEAQADPDDVRVLLATIDGWLAAHGEGDGRAVGEGSDGPGTEGARTP